MLEAPLFCKLLNVNCGPWSVHTLSGAPVQQNDNLRADTIFFAWCWSPFSIISGQSEKQSTVEVLLSSM